MSTRSKNKRSATSSRAATSASGVQAVRLARALQALAKGLPNPWDESTDFFRQFTASMPAKTKLDAESFRAALRIGARYELDFSPADNILAKLGKDVASQGRDGADGFAQLRTVMRSTLKDLQLVFARGKGVVRVRVWLFGRTHDGTLVGLRSESTET
jgi:hypothetical protein